MYLLFKNIATDCYCHVPLVAFYKQAPNLKTALGFTIISTALFYMADLFGWLFRCKIFGMALSIVWVSYLV